MDQGTPICVTIKDKKIVNTRPFFDEGNLTRRIFGFVETIWPYHEYFSLCIFFLPIKPQEIMEQLQCGDVNDCKQEIILVWQSENLVFSEKQSVEGRDSSIYGSNTENHGILYLCRFRYILRGLQWKENIVRCSRTCESVLCWSGEQVPAENPFWQLQRVDPFWSAVQRNYFVRAGWLWGLQNTETCWAVSIADNDYLSAFMKVRLVISFTRVKLCYFLNITF